MEEEGYEASIAVNRKKDLAYILKHKPDLILSDLSMPVVNGCELLKEFGNKSPSFFQENFIFLSANANQKGIISSLCLGADALVSQAGIGIGLTITRYLIEQMQGRVGLKSTVGEGSTFWIKLKLA